jgi:drug/metabolite transporter (DMT)-like permease
MWTNPATWLSILNALAGVLMTLESSGVTNMLPPSVATGVGAAALGINAVAHAFASAAPGPLNTAPVKS